MEVATVQGQKRPLAGHHANARLRKEGLVPAVIYGMGKAAEHIAVSQRELLAALEHSAHVVKLVVDGREEQYLIKEVQYDHLQKMPLHLDLMRVDLTKKVQVNVPLDFRGTAAGQAVGGVVIHVMADIEVECLVTNIPESIRVRVDGLQLGQSLHVRELELPEGVTALAGSDDIVCVCRTPRGGLEETPAAAAAEGEAASAEPEVIGKGIKDKDEEATEAPPKK